MPPKQAAGGAAAGGSRGADSVVDPDGPSSSRTHSREKLKLCEQMVLDHFGAVAAQISSILLERGRLTLKEIERFVVARVQPGATFSNPQAPARSQILHAILALVQHNILYHIRLDVDGSVIKDIEEPGGTEYYEVNPDAILSRARFGRYLEVAERLWGQQGLELTSLVLQNGKIEVGELLRQLPSTSSSTKPLLTHLLASAHFVPATLMSHLSPHDLRLAYLNDEKRQSKGILSPAQLRELEAKVSVRLDQDRQAEQSDGCFESSGTNGLHLAAATSSSKSKGSRHKTSSHSKSSSSSSSRRRKLAVEEDDESDGDNGANEDLANGSRKRQKHTKSNGSVSALNDTEGADWVSHLSEMDKSRLDGRTPDESVFVRINYDRFDVHLRNEVLRNLVSTCFNSSAADIYMAIAQAGEERRSELGGWPSVSDEISDPVSLTLLSSDLSSASNLNKGFDRAMFVTMSGAKKPTRYEFLTEYVAILSRVEDVMARNETGVNAMNSSSTVPNFQTAIRFLIPANASGSADVTTVTGSRISSAVSIDYASAGRKLKWNVLKRTVQAVFGDTEARVLGVLRKEGRLDEKHLSKLSLVSLAETREACSRLFSHSIISLQEVPRGADRNPARSFFFFFLDYPRALAWLSDHLYKTQGRLAQRREWEREKERALLKKIERTDVQLEGLEKTLTGVEQERLKDCQDRLRLLTVEEQRVEQESWILSRMKG